MRSLNSSWVVQGLVPLKMIPRVYYRAGIALVAQAVLSMNVHMPIISHAKISGLLFVIGLDIVLGTHHSTDADHVVAISTIITRQKSIRGAAIVGSVSGLGHTITIFIVGSMIILFKVEILPRIGLSTEFCVALMLVLLGALTCLARCKRSLSSLLLQRLWRLKFRLQASRLPRAAGCLCRVRPASVNWASINVFGR
jgi:hypothetical protein